MQNIRNLKDPPSYGALMMIMLLLLWLSPVAIAAASKVTCTEHDTKITCDCKHVDQVSLPLFLSLALPGNPFLLTLIPGYDHAPTAGQCLSG